jgi:hypothetical protein
VPPRQRGDGAPPSHFLDLHHCDDLALAACSD